MSIQFSNTTTKNGLIQHCEDECGFNDGDISGNTTLLAKFTAYINNALDDVFALLFKAGGIWQFDDINHTKYPEIKTNLVSGQRDYPFTTDEQGNLVLDIYKVMVMNDEGIFQEIFQVDKESANNSNVNVDSFIDGQDLSGQPVRYDMSANGIFLDPIPNYSETLGLKVFINREASYFTTSDTTKKAGFTGLFHYLLVLLPSLKYARIHTLPQYDRLELETAKMKKELSDNKGRRSRDINRRLRPSGESNK